MPIERDAFNRLGKTLNEKHTDELAAQHSVFQSALINFAVDHGYAISNNTEFRHKFTELCASIGVDPLELLLLVKSKEKKKDGFLLGIGVRMVEICQETRKINGGLISFKELHTRFQESVSVPLSISEADTRDALELLISLGKGYEMIVINHNQWIKFSGPTGHEAISNDQKKVYELCEFMGGFVTYRLLRDNFGWDKVRSMAVIEEMIMHGFLWIDSQGQKSETQFWEPSWISKTCD